MLTVLEDYRRSGVASALATTALNAMKAKGIQEVIKRLKKGRAGDRML